MKTEPDTAPVSPSHGENGNLWKTCALLLPFFWPVERKDLKTRVVVAVVSGTAVTVFASVHSVGGAAVV